MNNQSQASLSAIRIRPTTTAAQEQIENSYFLPEDPNDLLKADPKRRSEVYFKSDKAKLAGHLYRPPGISDSEATPAIIMCGPVSSVKEQTLPHYAERFADSGFTVLTFDPRFFGESEGQPRYHYDPNLVIEDFKNAVNYMLTRSDIDVEKIGIVGVCMGGGFAVSTAARDKRVKAVVSIAGGYNIGGTFQKVFGIEDFAKYFASINDLLMKEYETEEVQYIPATVKSLSKDVPIALMPSEEAYSYYSRTSETDAPNWVNKVTAASLESYFLYNAVSHAPLVAPTPLMVIHGTKDLALLPEYAREVYDAAQGSKELVWIETHNHIELYDRDPYVSEAVSHALRWLNQNLKTREKA